MEETEIIEANPHYVHIRFQNSKETTASLPDLAPTDLVQNYFPEIPDPDTPTQNSKKLVPKKKTPTPNVTESITFILVKEIATLLS